MKKFIQENINIHTLWLLMVTLTILSYAMGKFGFSGLISVLILLLTAVIKGTLIIRDFMELRGVSLLWQVIMYGWLWGITLALILIYIFSLS
jgi:cytochrome c oxidase subunit IV